MESNKSFFRGSIDSGQTGHVWKCRLITPGKPEIPNSDIPVWGQHNHEAGLTSLRSNRGFGRQFPDKSGGQGLDARVVRAVMRRVMLVMMLTMWMMLMRMLMRILESAVDNEDADDDGGEARQGGLLSGFCCG